jgi:hypothetical protein
VSLAKDFRSLPRELRTAALAAGALIVTMILPWYQKSYVPQGARDFAKANVSAFGVFTFVEAAVALVAVAVLFLVWARSQRKAFHLPGGDGVAITVAGGWAVLLIVWRLFDKPSIKGGAANVGIQWGIVFALAAAGALVAAGARVRAANRPEPPNPAADDVGWVAPERHPRERRDRRPRDASAVADVLRDRPAWEGEPPTGRRRDEDAETRRMSGDDAPPPRSRPRDDEAQTRRMSGDDAPPPRSRPRDDEAQTRRFRDDDEVTRRFRDDDAQTRRIARDDAPPPPPPRREDPRPPRLWDDDESAS